MELNEAINNPVDGFQMISILPTIIEDPNSNRSSISSLALTPSVASTLGLSPDGNSNSTAAAVSQTQPAVSAAYQNQNGHGSGGSRGGEPANNNNYGATNNNGPANEQESPSTNTNAPNPNPNQKTKAMPHMFLIVIPFIIILVTISIVTLANRSAINNHSRISRNSHKDNSHDDFDNDQPSKSSTKLDLRLPKLIDPILYQLQLIPLFQNSIVIGSIQIHLVPLQQSVHNITLHMKNITLHSAIIKEIVPNTKKTNPNPAGIRIINQVNNPYRDLITFDLNKPLNVEQDYSLELEFTSLIRDDLNGFYKSTYVEEEDGKQRNGLRLRGNQTLTLGLTQFEPISARTLFPCFDQPDFKSKFELSVARDSTTNYTVISNMEKFNTKAISTEEIKAFQSKSNLPSSVKHQHQWQNWVWDNFETSLPMSTYLLAFVISEFQYKETYFSSGKMDVEKDTPRLQKNLKPLKVWSRPDLINQTNFALEIAPKFVEFFEEYLGMEYPLEKLDLVGVPDFDEGAMENFGLITFRESEVFLDESETPESVKDTIASTIAHEISHQWFGDLVTIDWWSDLWLNEGFACYMEYVAVNHVEPTWNKMVMFLSKEVYDMLDLDVLKASHPISIEINNPDEVTEMFDSITYSKGAAVIKMLANFIGEKTFQRGLNRYLTKWKFNNSSPEDLWTAMTHQARIDGILLGNIGDHSLSVGEIMNTWTNEAGFPVVHVYRDYKENGKILFTQSQFNLEIKNTELAENNETGRKWWIPISYASPTINKNFKDVQPDFWLSAKKIDTSYEKEIKLDPNYWLILNVKHTGLYRVNYDTQNWKLLINQLHKNSNAISVENRGQLINDAWNLARASMLIYDYAFNLSNYLQANEKEFLPWHALRNAMNFLYNMYSRLPEIEYFKSYLRFIVHNQFQETGFIDNPSDSVPTKQTRLALIYLACLAEHPDCIGMSRTVFRDWMKADLTRKHNPVPVNYRKTIYCTAIKHGTEIEWNFLLDQYLKLEVPSTKKIIIGGLSCSQNKALIKRLIDLAVDGSETIIRKADGENTLKQIALNPIGTKLVLNLLIEKWLQITTYLPSVDSVIDVIGEQLNTKQDLEMLDKLKSKYTNNLGTSTRSLEQSLEKIALNIQWMDKFAVQVSDFMQKYK